MGNFAQNATVTKIRAMYGRRLKPADYKELLSKKNVSEVAEFLKHSPNYQSALTDVETAVIHRGTLENILHRQLFERYVRLCKFQHLDKDPFYRYLIKLMETDEISTAIIHLNSSSDDGYISSLPSYLINQLSFDLMELAKVTTYDELLNLIKNTEYYNLLKSMIPKNNGQIDVTACEVKLKAYYIGWLLNTVQKEFRGQTRENLTIQIQMQIDMVNIMNAYRMKKYFNSSAEEIEKNMIPFYGKLSYNKVIELIQTADEESFLNVLSKNIYGRQLEQIEGYYFEQRLTKLRCEVARRTLMFSQNAAVSLYSVIYLFEIELSNIINITEGIRYNRNMADIEKLLVM